MVKHIEEKSEKVNLKYIAKIANKSISTVSRALSSNPEASKATIKKIKKIAANLNYYPNAVAKSLRVNKSNTIGIILNDMNNPFYSDILKSIYLRLNKLGYSMIVAYYGLDARQARESERQNIINLLSKRVDGIIISPLLFQENGRESNIDLLIESNIETIFIDNCPNYENICYCGSDHKKAIYLATEYLIKNGHRDILLYGGPRETLYSKLCKDGYCEAFLDNNIQLKNNLIITLDNFDLANSSKFFKRLISKSTSENNLKFTAIVAVGDILAISIYKAAAELGLSIPNDFSIVSYDNIETAAALNPPLTTVHQPRKQIGEYVAKILINNINNKNNRTIEKSIITPSLVKRKSVKNFNENK